MRLLKYHSVRTVYTRIPSCRRVPTHTHNINNNNIDFHRIDITGIIWYTKNHVPIYRTLIV